jgi:hypothetical protein
LTAIIPIVAYDLYKNLDFKKIFNIALLPLFTIPILIRNFIYTGNPTFPAMNNLWKSQYFSTDPHSIIVSKYIPDWSKDLTLFFNFFSNSSKPLTLFYASSSNFYNPLFFSIFTFTFIYFLFNFKSIKSNIYLLFGFMAFYLTILLPGAQHKYFIPCFIFLTVGLYKIYDYDIYFEVGYAFKKKFCNVICFIIIFVFPMSPYSGVPLKIIDGKIYSNNYIDWSEKLNFYERFNHYIELSKLNEKKILLSYLQDKLLITSKNVYEYDWYDYYEVNPLMVIFDDISKSNFSDRTKANAVQSELCKRNYGFLVLNRDFFNKEFMNSLKLVVASTKQNAYELNCSN